MEIKHTPTPWVANEGGDGGWFIWNSNGGISTKALIGTCIGRINPDHRSPQQAKADALFIVRACNAYAPLLAAARRARELLNDHASFSDNEAELDAVDALDSAIFDAETTA